MMILGIDVSNFTEIPTPDQINQLWGEGYRFVVIGLQNGGRARQQKAAFAASPYDWHLEYYVDVPGRDLTIPAPGSRVWVDIEPGCITDRRTANGVLALIGGMGLVGGIYGNAPSIQPVIGQNSIEWAGYQLWYANYQSGDTPPDFDSFVPFNGWTRPTIWQYAGSVSVAGLNVDLNAVEGDLPPPAPPTPAVRVPMGIGVHYSNGAEAEVWTPEPGLTIDGIGIRFDDGSIETVWTPDGK